MHSQSTKRKFYTVSEGILSASKYCAYQDRCQSEVRTYLQGRDLTPDEIEEVIAELISDDFINEQRFADSFVRGKFNLKKWGRIKIKNALYAKQVAEPCIIEALSQIEEDHYKHTLRDIAEKKAREKGGFPLSLENKNKLFRLLLSRGFEAEYITEILNTLQQTNQK